MSAFVANWRQARRMRRWLDPPGPRTFVDSAVKGLRHRHRFDRVEVYCAFVGAPRTGSTLLASLLNAHPNALVSNELDALRYVAMRFHRAQLYYLIAQRDLEFGQQGRVWGGLRDRYRYDVPGQDREGTAALTVIGDKRGPDTCWWLEYDPHLLERLESTVRVPVRVLHTVRDPYDTVATMSRQSRRDLDNRIAIHHRLCEIVARIRRTMAAEAIMDVRLEDLKAEPEARLAEVSSFLGLAADEAQLRRCAQFVDRVPHPSREEVTWSKGQLAWVQRTIEEFDFFGHHYSPVWAPAR